MTRDTLLAVGASLAMLGIFVRGLARGQRRAAALRKQHELDVRKPGDPAPEIPHLEKHLPRYANAAVVIGLVIVGIALTH